MRMIAWATATAARCEPRRCLRREDWARSEVRVRAAARAASPRARRMAAVDGRRALPDHLRPGAGQRPHRPRLAGRDVAAPHPPVPQQLDQPLGVVAVGRPPRHSPRVARVHQRQLEPTPCFERGPAWRPGPPAALHRHGDTARSRRPAASASSPSVIVENRRSVFWAGPSGPGIPRQATTSRWWTSPHTRGWTPRPSLAHRHQAASVANAAPDRYRGCPACSAVRLATCGGSSGHRDPPPSRAWRARALRSLTRP